MHWILILYYIDRLIDRWYCTILIYVCVLPVWGIHRGCFAELIVEQRRESSWTGSQWDRGGLNSFLWQKDREHEKDKLQRDPEGLILYLWGNKLKYGLSTSRNVAALCQGKTEALRSCVVHFSSIVLDFVLLRWLLSDCFNFCPIFYTLVRSCPLSSFIHVVIYYTDALS